MHLQLYFAKYFLLGFIFGKIRDREIIEEKIQVDIRGFRGKADRSSQQLSKQRNKKQ